MRARCFVRMRHLGRVHYVWKLHTAQYKLSTSTEVTILSCPSLTLELPLLRSHRTSILLTDTIPLLYFLEPCQHYPKTLSLKICRKNQSMPCDEESMRSWLVACLLILLLVPSRWTRTYHTSKLPYMLMVGNEQGIRGCQLPWQSMTDNETALICLLLHTKAPSTTPSPSNFPSKSSRNPWLWRSALTCETRCTTNLLSSLCPLRSSQATKTRRCKSK